ncbi:unnamed protein product [Symbiodinium microadriaticum]|nr:unnamed protein product [Symbiodinium microadriaticum]
MSVSEERRQRRLAHNAKRYAGTYRAIPKLEWERLTASQFGSPDWASMYPLNAKGGPAGLLTPRMACKLFHDAVFIINKSDENVKFLQDKIPEACHKFYKKKQWRKQLFECARRVTCRIAKGLDFSPNCIGEDLFVHVLLANAFEMGWNRCRDEWEALPESDKDRDFNRVARLAANEEINALYRGESTSDSSRMKEWFKCYKSDEATLTNHFLYEVDLSAFAGDDDDDDA